MKKKGGSKTKDVPKKEKLTEAQLKKEQLGSIRNHLKEAENVVKRKKAMLDGKLEELGEDEKNPRDEIKQLELLVDELTKTNPEMAELLLAVKVDTRQLADSIDDECVLIDELEKDATGTSEREILKEIEEELMLAQHLEHQLNVLFDLQKLSKEVINLVDTGIKDEKEQDRVGKNLTNLNNLVTFLLNLVQEEEIPQLKLAYNLLKLEESQEVLEKINTIIMSFENMQPNVL